MSWYKKTRPFSSQVFNGINRSHFFDAQIKKEAFFLQHD